MIINFVANFQNGYVGEQSDSVHLAREMEALGHQVFQVPQDIWKEVCNGIMDENWRDHLPSPVADLNIITKWHHFTGNEVKQLRVVTNAPVFYWVWDYMWDHGLPGWHLDMVNEADLYLGNDVRHPVYSQTRNTYYFPFDVADEKLYPSQSFPQIKKYDVAFFGSWIGQGHRQEWLREINKKIPIKVFSWNYQDWPREFNVSPAVYGEEFIKKVRESKIILGFNVDPHTWGYWSNRVGKTLLAGGFLLQEYAPGMELFLQDGVEYFSTPEEAVEKIDHYLLAQTERDLKASVGHQIGIREFSSRKRVKQLMIMAERYLEAKKNDQIWKI